MGASSHSELGERTVHPCKLACEGFNFVVLFLLILRRYVLEDSAAFRSNNVIIIVAEALGELDSP